MTRGTIPSTTSSVGARGAPCRTRPNSSPVARQAAKLKAITGQPIAISWCRGMRKLPAAGRPVTKTPTAHHAASRPIAPPAKQTSRLSVINCRTNSLRRAPRAWRMATSLCRAVARARNRFARLAQAISSVHPTAPNRIVSEVRPLPTAISCRGVTTALFSALLRGYSCARLRATVLMSADACSQVTPGFRRPKARRVLMSRLCAFAGGHQGA